MTQERALNMLKTGVNIFLTGEPGSGKTFVTNAYVSYLKKAKVEVAVTASTGIAATHLGGRTIHSWSGIGIKKHLSARDIDAIASNEWVAKRIDRTRVLIIDEVSMLDGDTLSSVDRVCREVKRVALPFGGLQVIFVGDFFQLPPVVSSRKDEAFQRDLFFEESVSTFAFASRAWKEAKLLVCYLSEQHRQEDEIFLRLLSSLRRDAVSEEDVEILTGCQVQNTKRVPKGALKLYTHNVDVDRLNEQELGKIAGVPKTFRMTTSGKKALIEPLKRGCLSPETLALKKDAAVMFTKNHQKGVYVNGTLGVVTDFDVYSGYPVVKTHDGRVVIAEPADWSIEEHGKIAATLTQIPLRLAWAMTVHKSQGMSLDAALVDLSHAFVEGQGYVALSRVRTLKGLSLFGWNEMALAVHPEVLQEDTSFREQSLGSESAFGEIDHVELERLQEAFVKACGGIIPKIVNEEETILGEGGSRLETIRKKHPNAYRPWSEEEDGRLRELFETGEKVKAMAEVLGRQPGAIRARLVKLELVEA